MISLEDIKEKQEELNKMIKEYDKQDNLISTWDKNWRPEQDEEFYFITGHGGTGISNYSKGSIDDVFINHNRIFKTYELAEKWIEIDEGLRKLSFEPDWENESQGKYCLIYDIRTNKFNFISCVYLNDFPPFYFENEEKEILRKYSNEELKFYFNI